MPQTYLVEIDVSGITGRDWDDWCQESASPDVTLYSLQSDSGYECWQLEAMSEGAAVERVRAIVAGSGADVRRVRMVGGSPDWTEVAS